jgi:hypothetical protein
MKTFAILSFLTAAASAHAGIINLNGGDTIVIEANTRTTVSCGNALPGDSDALLCAKSIENMKSKYGVCTTNYTEATCFQSTFAKRPAACGESGNVDLQWSKACYEYCTRSYTNATCYQTCY